MTSRTTTKFSDLNAALDALGSAELSDRIEEATEALDCATTVETMDDFIANLDVAATALRAALAKIERMRARC